MKNHPESEGDLSKILHQLEFYASAEVFYFSCLELSGICLICRSLLEKVLETGQLHFEQSAMICMEHDHPNSERDLDQCC